MEKRWNILSYNVEKTASLQNKLKVSRTICKILTQRNFEDYDSTEKYFVPLLSQLHSPFLMKDMAKAVERIKGAISTNKKILVFGDYDVDGTTSVASMFGFLSEIYNPQHLDFYIPHRYREGYGVSKAGIDFAAKNNFKLIVCLDCGIKSVELIDYANTLGIDFIICDHHLQAMLFPLPSLYLTQNNSIVYTLIKIYAVVVLGLN